MNLRKFLWVPGSKGEQDMPCARQGCEREVTATITLGGTANAEGPGEKTYDLCSQHYHDTVHVLKTLQLLVNLPITIDEIVRTDDEYKENTEKMDIELFLILSAAYTYFLENKDDEELRRSIGYDIESYLHKQGYMYDGMRKEWTSQEKLAEIARRRTQGAKDGWEIRRGKQRGKE